MFCCPLMIKTTLLRGTCLNDVYKTDVPRGQTKLIVIFTINKFILI